MNVNSAEELNNIILNNKSVLLKFGAGWCNPCKQQDEILEDIDGISIVKINVDESPDIANEYSVMSIPTMIYFKNGIVVDKTVGVVAKEQIERVFM